MLQVENMDFNKFKSGFKKEKKIPFTSERSWGPMFFLNETMKKKLKTFDPNYMKHNK